MTFRTPPILWAWLAAILAAIVVFDLLVLGADDVGLREIVVAGILGLATAVAVLLVGRALIRRR